MKFCDIINILIVIVIVITIYKIYDKYYKNKKTSDDDDVINNNDDNDSKDDTYSDNNATEYLDIIAQSRNKKLINPYLTEIQYHNDYRDTLNALNTLLPAQKLLFNRSDLPIVDIKQPLSDEINPLVKNLIKEINKAVDIVPDNPAPTDWKNNYAVKKYKSGWDKQQEKLGLPGSIFTAPATKAHVKLLKIDRSEKYQTESEVRYVVYLILKKVNVDDQMFLRVSFQIDKTDYNLTREFNDNEKPSFDTLVRIEELYVCGYFTKISFGKHTVKEKYYNFDGLSDGRAFDDKTIVKELNKKRKQYMEDCL